MMTRPWLSLLVVAALAPACHCGSSVNPIASSFRAAPDPLDFGRVLEGRLVTQHLTLSSDSQATLTVTPSTSPPFSVGVPVDLPGGDSVALPVTFKAGTTEAIGALTLTAGTKTVSVVLHGVGVHASPCTPSAACVISTFSVEEGRCVETSADDDAPCDPGNACLELGRCKSGQCLGVSRSCDDNNLCTVDGCSATSGCVHTPKYCPAPRPCHLSVCAPLTGCGEVLAGDGTPCGTFNCSTAHLCLSGSCITVTPPEGTLCEEAMACQPEGYCHNKVCLRGDAGTWTPDWATDVPGVPSAQAPALLNNGASSFFLACGLPAAALGVDGGLDGGSNADGGADAGGDAGADADAGFDGGPTGDGGVCGLVSYTGNGFWRFTALFDDGLERRLVHLSPRGVLLLGDGGLEYRATAGGVLTEALALHPAIDAIAAGLDASVWLALPDGTLGVWPGDGGFQPVASLGSGQVLSLASDGTLYAWDNVAGVLSQAHFDADGGLHLTTVALDAGTRTLTVAGGVAVAGAGSAVRFSGDGGLPVVTPLDHQDWDQRWAPRTTLQTSIAVSMFALRCPLPATSCADALRAWAVSVSSLSTGQTWSRAVLPAGPDSQVLETALVDLSQGVAVGALSRTSSAGGPVAIFEVYTDTGVELSCQLASSGVQAGLFLGRSLLVLIQRPDAGYALESYGLKTLPVHQRDWAGAEGVDGWRRGQ